MSSLKKIIINCGATQVGVAVFSGTAGRPVLERFVVQDLDYDYASEDAWLGALSVALGGVVRGLKLSGPASVIVPGHLLLTKTIKVPQVEKSKQAQIIGFEAQNQIPYPLNEVVWDSQIISTDGVEAEVMLFALKQDVATRIAGVVAGTGLTPSVLEASTLLDNQAWRAINPGDAEDVLIINVGARTTNMTFVNASGFSVQNVNVGGNLLTQSISDVLAAPFRTAEALKVAYFSGTGKLSEDDSHVAPIKKCAQDFIRRVSQEVTRRVVIYKRQHPQANLARIILTGRGSLLPGLSEHLCETQRMSVDYIDPFGAFSVAPGVDTGALEASRVRLSEIVGEAAGASLPGSVGVNLLPAALESEIEFNRRKPLIVAAVALLALAPWPVYAHYSQANQLNKKLNATASANANEVGGYKKAIEDAQAKAVDTAGRVAVLNTAAAARENWRAFLVDLQSRVGGVKDVWIEDLRFKRTPGEPKEDGTPGPDRALATISLNMLLKGVAPGGSFDAGDYNAKRREILRALNASPFVAEIPASGEKSDLNKANLPKLTLNLVIKQAEKPL